jgi:hypothetical protein
MLFFLGVAAGATIMYFAKDDFDKIKQKIKDRLFK